MINRRSRFQTLLFAGCAASALIAPLSAPAASDQAAPVSSDSVSEGPEIKVKSSALRDKMDAIEQERAASIVKDILPEEEMRRLPDVSLAEALQRVPGVSMETDTGQGRFVNIRGMDTDLNGTYFDGVHLTANANSSPTGGLRGVAMDVFPTALVGSVEVIKTLTPDMDAEGVGGQVNMVSHSMPIGGASFLQAELGGGYEAQRGTPVYVGNVTAGFSFGPGAGPTPFGAQPANDGSRPFRLILNYDYDEDRRGINDVEASPSGASFLPLTELDPRYYQYHRVRQGYSAELDYDPDADKGFYLKGLRSGYREDANKHELLLESLDGSYKVNSDGSISSSKAKIYQYFVDRSETVTTSLITSGGHFMLGRAIKVDIQGAWNKGTDDQPKEYEDKFSDKANVTYNLNNPSQPSYVVTSPGVNLADPTQFTLHSIADKASLNFDQEYSARVNFTIPVVAFGISGEAKAGAAVRLRNNGVDNWETDANVPNNAPQLSQFVTGKNDSFGGYNLGSNINIDQVNNSVTSYTQSTDTVNQAWSRDTENVYAGYAQYSARLDRLSVVGGVRVEATDATQLANLQNADTDVYTPNKTRQDYVTLFPSVQGKYQMTQDLQLRAAFSTGIARPGFQQITASTTVSDDAQTVTTGNPNLKPMIADNYDIGASYDLPQSGAAGLGLFYKSFSDYIVQTGYLAPYQGQPAYLYTTFQNISSARAMGVEVNVYKPFTFLPSPYDGFGLIANYTYVNSASALRPGEKADEMPGTSPENANVELSYDKGPISARIGTVYKSSNLFIIGATRDYDQFAAPRLQLDLGASYQIDQHFQVYFSAKNLTNSPLIYTQGQSSANPIQHEYYDATYYTGIRASF